jgi:uncharacterized protein
VLERESGSEIDRGWTSVGLTTSRLCAATRAVHPISRMIRFVAGPDGVAVPDVKRRLPGRGVWVVARRTAVDEAVRRNVLPRSLKASVTVPSNLAAIVEGRLEQTALEALAMARKAGLAIAGFAKVEASLAAAPVVALIRALDAGQDGARKLDAALARAGKGSGEKTVPVIEVFTSAQLDLAFGRLNVVHAALTAGRPSATFLERWRMLEFFRADAGDEFAA